MEFIIIIIMDYGGAVLVQLSGEKEEMPLAFMSKKLSRAQRNYSVTERECYAVILAIEKFRCYLELQEFEVVTDHSILLWCFDCNILNSQFLIAKAKIT